MSLPKHVQHYLQTSQFTDLGAYRDRIKNELPDDIRELGALVRAQIIHRGTLVAGNTGSNADQRYGDMTKVPWWRQPEDDYFPTAISMVAELFRRDERGFVNDRAESDKMILTCRFVALLTTAILKAKGIPARLRSGFESYAAPRPSTSCDHWITQYWNEGENRWHTIDVDCSIEDVNFDPYDMPPGTFEWSADSWLAARVGKADSERFWNAGGFVGLMPISWELFYDLHCLMNNEIIYLHNPILIKDFAHLSEEELQEIDELARLMQNPDENFDALKSIFTEKREVRLLSGALL